MKDNTAEDLDIIYIDTDFSKLVKASFNMEARKVFNQDDEDDLNGWKLETREDEEIYSPVSSPLSSSAISHTPSPISPPLKELKLSHKCVRWRKHNSVNKPALFCVDRSKAGAKQKKDLSKSTDSYNYLPSIHALEKIKELDIILTEFDMADLHIVSTTWIGKC